MSRQPDAESYTSSRSRQRANTASFPSFGWMKPRQEPQDVPQPPPPPNLEALIQSLSPPAVPSIKNARALASAIGTQSPLPRRASLNPVLASLCDVKQPSSLQAVGFEILSAYFEHHEATALTTSERLSYFSLFLGPAIPWAPELWETRFKALRAMTRWGADIIGIETPFLGVLKSWIDGGFEGLLRMDISMDRTERSERERSIDLMATFLTSVVEIPETIARISEEELAGVLQFFAQLVDRSVVLPIDLHCQERLVSNFLDLKTQQQQRNWYLSTPPKTSPPAQSHRRNQSSVSISSSTSPSLSASASSAASTKFFSKHPAELAIPLYLNHLSTQLKISSPTQLNAILPVLFRALAFCSSPLPRLSLLHQTTKKSCAEETITETLNSLFTGPYSSSCMLILKEYLSPRPVNPDEFVHSPDSTKSPSSSTSIPTNIYVLSLPKSLKIVFLTARGAHRMFRNHVRRALFTRLARAYITRETPMAYSPSGAPGHMDVERDIMERVWPRDDFVATSGFGTGTSGWDAARLGKVLAESAEAWVLWHSGWDPSTSTSNGNGIFRLGNGDERWVLDKEREEKEFLLDEIANVLLDLLQELEAREEDRSRLDEEEAVVISDTLSRLAAYVLPLRSGDGTPFLLPLDRSMAAPTPFLRTLASLLGTDYLIYIGHLLPPVLLEVADNISDLHTARLCQRMAEQQDLSPTSPEWLDSWNSLLTNSTLMSLQRPLTRAAILETLDSVYESVRDMRVYRRPLADLVWEFSNNWVSDHEAGAHEDGDAVWRIIGEEVVLRAVEYDGGEIVDIDAEGEGQDDGMAIGKYIALLVMVSEECGIEDLDGDDGDTVSVLTMDTQSPSPHLAFNAPSSNVVSPILSRMQSDYQPKEKEKESALPSVMSILSSLTAANTSRTRLDQTPTFGLTPERSLSPAPTEPPSLPRCVAAASALIGVFSQLALTPFVLQASSLRLAIKIFETLVSILSEGKSSRVRVTVLQFLLRLRADRDHRIYYTESGFDADGHGAMLSSLIGRFNGNGSPTTPARHRPEEYSGDAVSDLRKARPKVPQERDGRPKSRGRGTGVPTASRSRSRVAAKAPPPPPRVVKHRDPLWHIPEILPFAVLAVDSPSEAMMTYDNTVVQLDSEQTPVPLLPISLYLTTLIQLVDKEKNWEIVSYILCHLPNQLANKHFFCGSKTTAAISALLSSFCSSLLTGTFGAKIERMQPPLKIRDAQGLAYHTLSVLVGHRRCFDMQQRHLLIEGLQAGLNGQHSTIKCCLYALSIAAFELQPSLIRYLPRIMEKLSQIMSNPNMSVHILDFLSLVGSLPPLYANFTEADYKVVFGLALQYLQHYNRLDSSPTVSWALSQHVRILAYYVVYVWFLALKLPDRPRHVRFITRQLLLANEGRDQVDGPTEVCFDWLSRYTYASADPRPARSLLSEIVMNPTSQTGASSREPALSEKTWIAGNAVMTIRTLARLGWVEAESRRPSGFSRFLCHVENAPMVGLGDVDPDKLSVPLALMMEREHPAVEVPKEDGESEIPGGSRGEVKEIFSSEGSLGEDAPRPDPVTGYIWSGSAPSQRRKGVAVDPSYLLLQLSSYPDLGNRSSIRMVPSAPSLSKFFATLDRVPVIDTHKVGIMYVAPGQTTEIEILRNTHGSPAYTHFLEGIGRLINLRGQLDVYAGGLDPDEDGEYAYAWWDDIGQVLYHTATMMPTSAEDPNSNNKKRHIGNDYVRIVWNDSGKPYQFGTLTTQFQFVNIVIEPHSRGAIAAFSNNLHENEYFKVTVQRAPGMTEFTPIGHFKLISAENLPLLVRQISLLADWFASVFAQTQHDTARVEVKTNWLTRLEAIRRFRGQLPAVEATDATDGLMGQEAFRDFTTVY
ncbi:hypothetical protein BDN72DRAFT_796169 [Pluteus cervinus]|uniref:Uncharacterized protein n=1 Tax=Pluteus cervinus TaxID=181527 RepID=A0ACD3AVQ5_9AGAR|nr:hypothetical protein BDN72DRAFT_796169 [Pluteus cervinus]